MYRIGHTMPKTYPGGLSSDLLRLIYQGSDAVLLEDRPPRTRAKNININIKFFRLKSNLFNSKEPFNSVFYICNKR
jgi:hypothetical protein